MTLVNRIFLFLLLIVTLCAACNRTAPIADESQETASEPTDTEPNLDGVSEITASLEFPDTAEGVIQEMQIRLQDSIVENKTTQPAAEDVEKTIQFGKEARVRFPDSDQLTQALTAMMYQSLQFLQADANALKQRRLELGQMARTLSQKPSVLKTLGNMPSFLMLEEAKGYLADQKLKPAWQAVQESRRLGTGQAKLLHLDPAFAALLDDNMSAAEIQRWLLEDLEASLASHEKFNFPFNLRSLDPGTNETFSLADFSTKPLLLVHCWGTWIPQCRAMVPHLVDLQNAFENQLTVLGINFEEPLRNVEFEAARAALIQFKTSEPINYPCVFGDFDPREKIPKFAGFPTLMLIEPSGDVLLTLDGYHPPAVLKTIIQHMLRSLSDNDL